MSRSSRNLGLAFLLLIAAGGAMRLSMRDTATSMTTAALEFLGSLSAEQRAQATMAMDDPQRTNWNFIPLDKRKGLQIKEMDASQRKLALALLQRGLSEVGYSKASQIMSLEILLRELEKSKTGTPLRDPERYYFTIYGEPKADGRWGWSAEGHHLSLNFALDAGQVVSTPSFFGVNPATVKEDYGVAPAKGTRVLGQEEQLGFDLLAALDGDQRKLAVIAEKAPAEILTAGGAAPKKIDLAGIPASKLNDAQRKILLTLLETHARNMAPELSTARLAEIHEAGLDALYFAWAGADKPGVGHYYRIQAPTFVVELVNVQPDAAGNVANHIHAVWRSLTEDFGVKP